MGVKNTIGIVRAYKNGKMNVPNMTVKNAGMAEDLIVELEDQAFDENFRDITYRDVVPTQFGNNLAVSGYSNKKFDIQGKAKIIGGYSDDLPTASFSEKGRRSEVKLFGIAYQWNIVELARAAATGEPMEENRAEVCRFGMESSLNDLCYKGNEHEGIYGLFNHPSVPYAVVSGNAGGTSTKWSDKSADEILADVNSMCNGMVIDSNNRYVPTRMLLPLEQYHLISSQRIPETDHTVLTWIVEKSPYINNANFFRATPECKGAGMAGEDVALVMDYDARYFEMKVPYAPQFLPAQVQSLHWKRPMIATSGGLVVRIPEALNLFGGI